MTKSMCVVGSGPSGVACAHTLLKAGHEVTLLDAGFTLEAESRNLLSTFKQDHDTDALIKRIHQLRLAHQTQSSVQPAKSLFGSEHPYRTVTDTSVATDGNAVVRSSLARGGLSTVWGANVSTVIPKDIADWPISFDDLEPYYSSLREIVDVSSPRNEMSDIFPLEIGDPPTFALGLQAGELLGRLHEYEETLKAEGIHIGRAKLAIGSKYSLDGKGCTPCGLCMHGCPNQAIFNASFALERLEASNGFRYQANTLVERFSEEEDSVTLHTKDLRSGHRSVQKHHRVFLACGVINTTSIVARSLDLTEKLFTIRDSQKYIVPLLRWHRSKGAVKERANTSAQIFLDIDNPSVSPNIVHVQYYGYNDLYLDPMRAMLGTRVAEYLPRLLASFYERLMIGFVYLHSAQSGTMSLQVHHLTSGDGPMATIRGHVNPESERVMKSVTKLLWRHRHAHGGVPVGLGIQSTLPGDSQHIGGTLPMSKSATNYHQTDCLGRPFSCRRVHVVDASALPSIPATPVAFTVMANASRIADLANRESA
jgi:choline dehydrogenase-like flavoprotein